MSELPLHPAAAEPRKLLADCDVVRTRRSGPGGQNRNKVETAVVLRHRPTGIAAEASERRSQAENLHEALSRLRLKLAIEVRQSRERACPPSVLWQNRCRGHRITLSNEHADYPTLLAEALDAIAAHGADVKAAAQALRCSASQLVKLLRNEPRALVRLNAERELRGLRRLQ